MLALLKSRLISLRGNRRGAIAAEFAMVAPLLFVTMFAIIEYGFVFYGYSAMQFGANAVARSIAVNKLKTNNAQTSLNSYLPRWMGRATVVVQKSVPTDASRSWVQLRVTAPASSTTPIKIFTTAIPWTLSADVAVKQELPYDN
jgi:Flp pilus assembly protein TadG